jgi:hypothetical protein
MQATLVVAILYVFMPRGIIDLFAHAQDAPVIFNSFWSLAFAWLLAYEMAAHPVHKWMWSLLMQVWRFLRFIGGLFLVPFRSLRGR